LAKSLEALQIEAKQVYTIKLESIGIVLQDGCKDDEDIHLYDDGQQVVMAKYVSILSKGLTNLFINTLWDE